VTAVAAPVEGMVAEMVVDGVAATAAAGPEPCWVDKAEVWVGQGAPVAVVAATAVEATVVARVAVRVVVEGVVRVVAAAAAARAVAARAVVAVGSVVWLEAAAVARPVVTAELKVAPGSPVDEEVAGGVEAWRADATVLVTEGVVERRHPCSSACSCSRGS